MIRAGDEGQGQSFFDCRLRVARNFRGDVQIVRDGGRVSWLDLSPDAAVALAMALLSQAGFQRVPTFDGRLLDLTP
jgi:hypothetical protein